MYIHDLVKKIARQSRLAVNTSACNKTNYPKMKITRSELNGNEIAALEVINTDKIVDGILVILPLSSTYIHN